MPLEKWGCDEERVGIERVVQRQFTNWPLDERTVQGAASLPGKVLLPTWKQGRFRMLSGEKLNHHQAHAVGTPLTSATEAYSLTNFHFFLKEK